MIELEAARLVHVGPIASEMREADVRECEALGKSPKDALRGGLRCSLSVFTAMDGRRPVAMLGVVPVAMLGSHGVVWMLGTNDLFNHTRDFLRLGPQVLPFWMKTFKRIDNIVSVENEGAIRMLRRWNFTIGSAVHVFGGLHFVDFWMLRDARFGQPLSSERPSERHHRVGPIP